MSYGDHVIMAPDSIKMLFTDMGFPFIKIRPCHIYNGILIHGKMVFIFRQGPGNPTIQASD